MIKIISSKFRRAMDLLISGAVLALMNGCAVTTTMYADEQIQPYLRSLTKRADYPLARSLTWKYHYTVGAGKHQQAWFVADGELIRSAKAMAGVQMYAAPPTTSGVTMSDVYTQRAREASARGRHVEAQIYHGLSATSLQTQIASERVAAGFALAGAIQNLGAGLLDATIISRSESAAKYIKERNPSIISDRAPDGTVLELFFRAHKADGAEAKPADVTMRWEVVATLKDANGKLWRSSASFNAYLMYAFGSEPKPTPGEFKQGRYVQMDFSTLLPVGRRDAYAGELQEIGKIATGGGYVELAVTALRAIDDIYEQIEYAKKRGRR
jgi:hypothetical protein